MRVGILTGGGDCPGLNAVIRAVVTKGERQYGDEVVGFRNGWGGVMEGDVMPLSAERCEDILPLGGTILGTSRANPYATEGGAGAVRATLERERIDALIAVGGDDTLTVAGRLAREGVSLVGVPKTIDNDLAVTELTFGFHTAVQSATDAIDRLRTTGESHHRVMVVEVMGRETGWIATYAGIAGGATEILIPEEPFDMAGVCGRLLAHHGRDVSASVVVVAEGARPSAASSSSRATSATPSGTSASAASGASSPTRSRPAPDSRRASPCSATSSAAAPPPPSTASSPPASGSPRSTPSTTATRGRPPSSRRTRSASPPSKRSPPSRSSSTATSTRPSPAPSLPCPD